MENDTFNLEFLERKAREKGINPIYPSGMGPEEMRKKNVENIIADKLGRIADSQVKIEYQLQELIKAFRISTSRSDTKK